MIIKQRAFVILLYAIIALCITAGCAPAAAEKTEATPTQADELAFFNEDHVFVPNKQAAPSLETPLTAAVEDEEGYGSADTPDDAAPASIAELMASDPLSVLTKETGLKEHEFIFTQIEDTDIVVLDRAAAISAADKETVAEDHSAVKQVSAVLARLTDTRAPVPVLPGTNIRFTDHPVWIVTFYGATVARHGPGKGTAYVDTTIIIDAQNGETLFHISHGPSIL